MNDFTITLGDNTININHKTLHTENYDYSTLNVGEKVFISYSYGFHKVGKKLAKIDRLTATQIIADGKRFKRSADKWIVGQEIGTDAAGILIPLDQLIAANTPVTA